LPCSRKRPGLTSRVCACLRPHVRDAVAPRQKPAAAWPYVADTARHAPSGGPRVPPRPSTPSARSPGFPTASISSSSPHSSARPQSRLRHSTRHRRRRRSGRSASQLTPPSCPEFRLSLAQLVLAPVGRGKPPLRVNCSPEFRPSSPKLFAPWTALFRSTFFSSSMRILLVMAHRCSSTFPVTVAWSGMAGRRPPAPPLRHWRRRAYSRAPPVMPFAPT
jgi:hypothetical protein